MYQVTLKLCFLFLTLILFACTPENSVPNRPETVPNDAMWIGGMDGGAWVLLEKFPSDPANIYRAEIYGDQAGDRWYIGRLEVVPKDHPAVPLDDPDVFGVWDGDDLLLKDGRLMRSIDSFDPFKE